MAQDYFTTPAAPPAPLPAQQLSAQQFAAQSFVPVRRTTVSRVPLLAVVAAVAVLLAGGAYVVTRLAAGPSDRERIAEAFRSGKPPSFLPEIPDPNAGVDELDGAGSGPGDATAWLRAYDPAVRTADSTIVTVAQVLDRWAHGKATDADVRASLTALRTVLRTATATTLVGTAPTTLRAGLVKLRSAVSSYDTAFDALEKWLAGHDTGSRTTYHLAVRTANGKWDTGITTLYAAAHLTAPPLPHPAKR